MRCSKCQHDNRADAKYCEDCGAPAERICPSCAAQVLPTAKFCAECAYPLTPKTNVVSRFVAESFTPKHLAERILTTRSALEGERKQVTVLFADIKGSMELIADRDPEEAQKILDPVLDRMIEAVHHFEGTVNRVMGDGIMALFGAPLAHEDHAVRACYASLRMQETVGQYTDEVQRSHGVPVTIRVGLNSGEIVIAAIRSDLFMDYTVVGQTVHLAQRMEQMAKPGTVLTTSDTLRLAEGYVTAQSLGLVPVKGLNSLIEVHEILGGGPARTRLQAAAWRGWTRFVGRDSEIDHLRQALDQTRVGLGQVISVVGEPGVGKSRLVQEFVHSHHTADWLVLETNSASYTHATSYLPVIELLKHYFQINFRDSTQAIREKVAGKILALDSSLQDIIPPLFDLLDVLVADHPFQSLDPRQHRQHTFQAITRLLLSVSKAQPVVVVFEDLHWNDTMTLGLLNDLVVASQNARIFLLVSYRPEYHDEWKGRPNYRELRLDPLVTERLAELLESLLGLDESVSPLKTFLLERARGNPFFVEEIARSLIDSGVLVGARGSYILAKSFSSNDVPPTVQAVLAARIDALPAAEKRLLQEAAVIGYDVPVDLLAAIFDQSVDRIQGLLANLEAAEFLYATQLFPDLQYTFKHSLTHDVAYGGLLHDRRRDIHARIVTVIEKLYSDRLNEQVERLADHAVRGNLKEKSVVYLRQAGAKAADRQAYHEAVVLLEQALGSLAQLPESRDTLEQEVDIRFDLRNVLQPLGDRERIAKYLVEAEVLADRLEDTRRIGWVQSYFTEQFWMFGRYSQSIAAGERALAVAEQLADVPLQVVTNLPLGLAHHTQGNYQRAIECFGWNVDRLQGEQARERFGMFVLPSTFSRSFMAWGLAELGQFDEGSLLGTEALRIAEAAEHPFSCGYAHLGLGVLSLRQGNLKGAMRSFENALAAEAFADSPVGFAYVALHLGYALALTGRAEEGIPILQESAKVAESKGFIARHALRLAYLSEAYLVADRASDAASAALRALALAREHDERANEAYALRVLGMVDARCFRPLEAEARFNAALQLARELGMRPLEARCHHSMAEIFDMRCQTSVADFHRKSASTLADEMEMQFWGRILVKTTARE